MSYQDDALARNMMTGTTWEAEEAAPEERRGFDVLPGSSLDARAREGASPRFMAVVARLAAVVVVALLLGMARVAIVSSASDLERSNAQLRQQIFSAEDVGDGLEAEVTRRSSRSRVTSIATGYGMVRAETTEDLSLGDRSEAAATPTAVSDEGTEGAPAGSASGSSSSASAAD